MGAFMGSNVYVNSEERTVFMNGKLIPFDKRMKGNSITTINGKCYIDGYEFINGKWKRTFWASFHRFF